jgi:hypothetical protein
MTPSGLQYVLLAINVQFCAYTNPRAVLGRVLLLHVSSFARSKPPFWLGYLSNNLDSVVESLVNVVYWFPFYFTFKFVFLLWLSLPAFRSVFPLPHLLYVAVLTSTHQRCSNHLPIFPAACSWPLLLRVRLDCCQPPCQGRLSRQGRVSSSNTASQ